MNILIDTHVLIWALAEPGKLSEEGRRAIISADNSIHVSAASIWEIAIKTPLGKISDPPISARDAVILCSEAGFQLLDITPSHAAAVEALPMLHRDPFDRLLVAQARSEPMRLLTRDRNILAYGGDISRV